MPPRFGISAPKCPRCEKSVYQAEQVIGPNSTPYHKSCLLCITCNKRLDSTLLVEHDGQPLCKNCHRSHLGQGKGGFGKAVPVRATLPVSPPTSPAGGVRRELAREDDDTVSDEMMRSMTGISISARPREEALSGSGPSSYSPVTSRPSNPTPAHALDPVRRPPGPSPPTPAGSLGSSITSIDDAVASGMAVPTITPRSAALRDVVGGVEEAVGSGEVQRQQEERSARPTATMPASSPPAGPRRLPSPVRRTPTAASNGGYKTSATAGSPSSASSPFRSQYASGPLSSPNTTPTRLASSITTGTPLCSRCSRPAYHAEAVVGATSGGRVWHRACLKCEACGTTLRKGTVEEGPEREGSLVGEGCNTFCRNCFKMNFGPRGIGSAGSSYPVKGV